MNLMRPWKLSVSALAVMLLASACGQAGTDSASVSQPTKAEQADWQRFTSDAEAAVKRGDTAEAERDYKAAMAEAEKLGADNPSQAVAIANLANFYYVQGDGAQADQLYTKSLAIREKALGLEHVDLVQDLVGLAKIRTSQKKFADASEFYSRAIAILKKADKPVPADLESDYAKAQASASSSKTETSDKKDAEASDKSQAGTTKPESESKAETTTKSESPSKAETTTKSESPSKAATTTKSESASKAETTTK